MIEKAYAILFGIAFIVLGLCIFLLILRSIRGPGVTVRVICVNMIGTAVTSVFAMLAVLFREGWLFDICVVYVLISFLSVAVLSKVYMRRAEPKAAGGDGGKGGRNKKSGRKGGERSGGERSGGERSDNADNGKNG